MSDYACDERMDKVLPARPNLQLPSGQHVFAAEARKEIAHVLQYWLDNNARQAAAEGRDVTPATHVMPSEWPDRGTLANWVAVLKA